MATRAFGGALRRREHAARVQNPVIHNHMYPAHAPQLVMANILRGCVRLNLHYSPRRHIHQPSRYLNLLIYLVIILFMIYAFRGDLEQSIAGRRLGTSEAHIIIGVLFTFHTDVVQKITMCAKDYKSNLCAINPIPAMALQCATWETCMNQDPTLVGRLRVGAELIAEMANSFVEPITMKTLVSSGADSGAEFQT